MPEFAADSSVHHFYPSEQFPPEFLNTCMREYVNNVVRIQYLLGDRNVLPNMIWDSIQHHPDSHEAVNLLSRAYYGRQSNASFSMLQSTDVQTTISALLASLRNKGTYQFSADDAMAALHVVSLFLFEGGQGRWEDFLAFAAVYVRAVLDNGAFRGPADALECASAKDQFVVKTTIWFDVLAAITTRRPPLLLHYTRALFDPNRGWVGAPPRYSMLSPMGCENRVVWALAETAYLAEWKTRQETAGTLSMRVLLQRAEAIDAHLHPPPRPAPAPADADACARAAAAEIFRTSARLFLRSVESGPFPHVGDVHDAAYETFTSIVELPAAAVAAAQQQTRGTVVRSTVFGIFICGSLTEDPARRETLKTQLLLHAGQEGVGNCAAVSCLLDRLWAERDSGSRNAPVRWRERLAEAHILLV